MYECLYKRVTNTENSTAIMKGEKNILTCQNFRTKNNNDIEKVDKSQIWNVFTQDSLLYFSVLSWMESFS